MMNDKKIFIFIFSTIFLGLFFTFPQKTNAAVINISANCTYSAYVVGMTCDVFNDTTVDTNTLSSITIQSNNFDDCGTIIITGPHSATQSHNTAGCSFGTFPVGTNITTWFGFDGPGIYTIRASAKDILCCNMGGWANFEVTTVSAPSCKLTASPPSVLSGDSADLTWASTNATKTEIDKGVGVVTPTGGGSTSVSPASTTTYTLTATGPGGTCTKSATVTVTVPVPPKGGLIPCGRMDVGDDPANIDMSKPCTLCAMFYMLKKIINFIMTLAIGIGVFILVIAGLIYATSAGNPGRIELAKSAIKNAIIGIVIIFIAWVVIAAVLQGMGYANIATWNQVNCVLPT